MLTTLLRTTQKQLHISVCGVILKNNMEESIKMSRNVLTNVLCLKNGNLGNVYNRK